MVSQEKQHNALLIIQRLIIYARKMAYEKEDHQKIAELLDEIEYLSELLNKHDNQTDAFRNHLIGIAEKYGWTGLIERFNAES